MQIMNLFPYMKNTCLRHEIKVVERNNLSKKVKKKIVRKNNQGNIKRKLK